MGKKSEKPKVAVFAYFYGLAYALASKVDEIIAFKRNGVETDRPNLKGSGSFWAELLEAFCRCAFILKEP